MRGESESHQSFGAAVIVVVSSKVVRQSGRVRT